MRHQLVSVRRFLVATLLVGAVGACGPLCGNGTLSLSNPHINPTLYSCPGNANNFEYPMDITVDAANQSSNTTIRNAATETTVTNLSGKWSIKVGAKSGDPNLTFSPRSIGAGSKTTLTLTAIWFCTSASPGPTTYADYGIVLTLTTSNGNYSINLPTYRVKMP